MEKTPSDILYEYYAETDPAERAALLERYIESSPDDPMNPLRLTLWRLRSEDQKTRNPEIDRFPYNCVLMLQMFGSRLGRNPSSRDSKEFARILRQLGIDAAKDFGQAGQNELYLEHRNGAKRYFSICESDRSYRSAFLGFGSISDKALHNKIAGQAYKLSVLIPQYIGRQEDLEPFSRAIKDEFFGRIRGAAKLWEMQDK